MSEIRKYLSELHLDEKLSILLHFMHHQAERALRLVQTTTILLQPATNAVHCSKNRKISN